jgi:hypothetical protein
MVNERTNRIKTGLLIGLILLIVVFLALIGNSLSITTLNAKPSTVYSPAYSTLKCEQTRIEYYPGGDANNKVFESIPQSGYSYWCGSPTLSNSYHAEGCDIYMLSSGWLDLSTIKVCDSDGINCQNANMESTDSFTQGSRRIHIDSTQKLFVDPNVATYQIRIISPVYGISIEGVGVKPSYSSNCNVQSLLSSGAIVILKNNPDYAKILATNQYSESMFPQVFITSYLAFYKDMRVIAKDGIYYFVANIGYICTIEQGSDGLYYVSNTCHNDASVQCYPGVGNCNDNAQLTTTPQATCTPGTLIGTSGGQKNVYGDKACYLKCNSAGVQELTDCTTIQKCSAGYTWNLNYECILASDANAKNICEANGNNWVTTKNVDGSISSSCEKPNTDLTAIYLLLGFMIIIMFAIVIKLSMRKSK